MGARENSRRRCRTAERCPTRAVGQVARLEQDVASVRPWRGGAELKECRQRELCRRSPPRTPTCRPPRRRRRGMSAVGTTVSNGNLDYGGGRGGEVGSDEPSSSSASPSRGATAGLHKRSQVAYGAGQGKKHLRLSAGTAGEVRACRWRLPIWRRRPPSPPPRTGRSPGPGPMSIRVALDLRGLPAFGALLGQRGLAPVRGVPALERDGAAPGDPVRFARLGGRRVRGPSALPDQQPSRGPVREWDRPTKTAPRSTCRVPTSRRPAVSGGGRDEDQTWLAASPAADLPKPAQGHDAGRDVPAGEAGPGRVAPAPAAGGRRGGRHLPPVDQPPAHRPDEQRLEDLSAIPQGLVQKLSAVDLGCQQTMKRARTIRQPGARCGLVLTVVPEQPRPCRASPGPRRHPRRGRHLSFVPIQVAT